MDNGQYIKGPRQTKERYPLSTLKFRSYSIICLIILVFYLIRPVLPYIEYAINKDYISKYLCINKDKPENLCDGKCYLHEQLKKNSEPVDADEDKNKKFVQYKKIEEHLKSDGIFTTPFEKDILVISYYCPHIIDSYISSVFVPPKF